MSATSRKIAVGSVVMTLGETRARRVRREIGDPQPKPVSVAKLRRQREADEAVADAQDQYGIRVTG